MTMDGKNLTHHADALPGQFETPRRKKITKYIVFHVF
jgi:hypothetical protein